MHSEHVSRKQLGVLVRLDRLRLPILDANDRQAACLDHAVRIADQSRYRELRFNEKVLICLELDADIVEFDPGLLQFGCQTGISFALEIEDLFDRPEICSGARAR